MKILFIVYVVLLSNMVLGQTSSKSFEQAFDEAERYYMKHNDPASVQKKRNLYYSVIESFPDNPEIPKVYLRIISTLIIERSESSIAQAKDLFDKLISEADLDSEIGQQVALEYLDFHLITVRVDLQDLDGVKKVIQQLIMKSKKYEHSLLGMEISSREASLLVIEKRELDAVKILMAKIIESNEWGADFWEELSANNQARLEKYQDAIMKISSSMGWAIERGYCPEMSTILRKYPGILHSLKLVSKVLSDSEKKYIDENKNEFEKIQEQVLDEVIESNDMYAANAKSDNMEDVKSTEDSSQQVNNNTQPSNNNNVEN